MSPQTDIDPNSGIAGKCVLVVEDDYVLAREVCNDLKSHGAQILGPAPTVHYAQLIIGKRRLDGAILDIKLFGEEVYELVEVLIARGVPIIFATAYQPDRIDARFRSLDILSKPLDFPTLRRKVAAFQPTRISLPEPEIDIARALMPPVAMGREGTLTNQDRWSRLMIEAMRLNASRIDA